MCGGQINTNATNSLKAALLRFPVPALLAAVIGVELICASSAAERSTVKVVRSETMPKPAPSFRPAAATPRSQPGDDTAFRVRIPQEPMRSQTAMSDYNRAPLTGRVNEFGQRPLSGGVADWQPTPSKMAAPLKAGVIQTQPGLIPGRATVAPEVFRSWLNDAHPDFALATSRVSAGSLIEVKGIYDDASKTLRSLGIPYTRVSGRALRDMPLAPARVMIVNCPGHIPREAIPRIREFVNRGGYLLSTDWSDEVVEAAFPGYIQQNGKKNDDSIYDARIVNPDPVLFARTVSNAGWKMDTDSHLIQVLRPDVRVLATSSRLMHEDPSSRGVLAVVFPFGRGYVMHMIAHFDNNTALPFMNALADPAPVIGISLRQAIAANFVVAGLKGTRIPPK